MGSGMAGIGFESFGIAASMKKFFILHYNPSLNHRLLARYYRFARALFGILPKVIGPIRAVFVSAAIFTTPKGVRWSYGGGGARTAVLGVV